MYSARDKQRNDYFHAGRNAEDRSECVSAIRTYLVRGSELPDDEYEDHSDEEILEMFDVEIVKHDEPIETDHPRTTFSP